MEAKGIKIYSGSTAGRQERHMKACPLSYLLSWDFDMMRSRNQNSLGDSNGSLKVDVSMFPSFDTFVVLLIRGYFIPPLEAHKLEYEFPHGLL